MNICKYINTERTAMKNTFSLFTIFITIAALILGNLVVATNSGDACGTDYPFCNGQLIPDITNYHIIIEYSHRLFTMLLGFIILINFIIAWKKSKNRTIRLFSLFTLSLLFIQSLIGGLNVLFGTPTGFTTLDVMFSLFLLISLIFLHVGLNVSSFDKKTNVIRQPLIKGFFFLLVEILIGALFKHFELSQQIFQISTNRFNLSYLTYFIHGILGLLILFYISYAVFLTFKWEVFKKKATLLISLTFLTTIGGFISKSEQISPFTSSVHMILTILTLALLSYMTAICFFNQMKK
ncbi:heme A synthase [Bacillus sp. AFS040349]|nr:heme A synthase [Bacillus sp. AFS040349]